MIIYIIIIKLSHSNGLMDGWIDYIVLTYYYILYDYMTIYCILSKYSYPLHLVIR